MPPKKKPGKKKGKKSSTSSKSKTPTVVDGVSTTEMTKEELEEHIIRLREELEREREERNYFQLERDKVNTFWEISKQQLEDRSAELRNKEREMEESEERHQLELKVYKQKVKHLLYEHQNNISELKAETATAIRINQEEHLKVQGLLRQDEQNLKIKLRETQLSSEDNVRTLKKEHEHEMHEIRKDFERKMEEQKKIYMKNTKELKEKLDLQRKNELHETEERKNNHINALMRSHEKSYAEMKNYYNDITLNNLALINTLKEQLEERKKNEERLERRANEIAAENRRLVEPLNKAKEENTEMKRQMANYEKDKTVLKATERNDLYEKFVLAIQEVQQKCGLKNILLEKRLTALTETIEKKEAQLSEVLSASNLDPISMATVSRKLGAHNDLLLACESKLQQFGIPFEELGFRPLKTTLNTQKLGHGPAGLVSVPP
ncbi:growth arrest-specific protein 8 [Schistosoma bovis]|uniref:Dynein regulatory complex subunit 4 n=1 Tax=Schistosoma bovis TaxID=6184 RepID=A0A430QGJ9_SCHBO|nr:growth arrest-specific protein 8 [Schistosoma bovis]